MSRGREKSSGSPFVGQEVKRQTDREGVMGERKGINSGGREGGGECGGVGGGGGWWLVEVAATGAGMASTTVPRATPAATGGGGAWITWGSGDSSGVGGLDATFAAATAAAETATSATTRSRRPWLHSRRTDNGGRGGVYETRTGALVGISRPPLDIV